MFRLALHPDLGSGVRVGLEGGSGRRRSADETDENEKLGEVSEKGWGLICVRNGRSMHAMVDGSDEQSAEDDGRQ